MNFIGIAVVSRRLLVTGLLLAALAISLCITSASAQPTLDRGRPYSKPPARYQGEAREIWKVEWTVCGGDTMQGLARDPDVRLSLRTLRAWLAISPQYAARRLAYFIESGDGGGGWTGHNFNAAVDGCRNGILYVFYRPWLRKK